MCFFMPHQMGHKTVSDVPAKTPLSGGATAFVEPFLDVNKITEDTASLLKFMEKRTTADWINFIGVCHEEWDDLEAQNLLGGNIQEAGGDDDEDEMDEDEEEDEGDDYDLCEGNLELENPPADFVWEHALEEATLKSELDKGSPMNSTEAFEELTAAFGDLEGMVVESRRGSRQDALDVLTHVGLSVTDIVAAINRINKRGRRWVSQIGRIEELREEIGRDDVTFVEAVLGLGKTMMAGGPPEDLTGAVDDLTKTVDEIDHDLARNCTLLHTKIQALERQQVTGPSTAGLTMSTPIFDDAGNQVSMLGRVMQDNVDLTRANELLKGRIERLAADVTAQGGVTLGRYTFTSELQLMELCMRECPSGDAFSAFVDPMVIFCHDASYTLFQAGRLSQRRWRNRELSP
jgi:hypothetical protein